ncbi:hypothetical protein PENTCL1PPCAC_15594, partial [Pristionchus entomophagus]
MQLIRYLMLIAFADRHYFVTRSQAVRSPEEKSDECEEFLLVGVHFFEDSTSLPGSRFAYLRHHFFRLFDIPSLVGEVIEEVFDGVFGYIESVSAENPTNYTQILQQLLVCANLFGTSEKYVLARY